MRRDRPHSVTRRLLHLLCALLLLAQTLAAVAMPCGHTADLSDHAAACHFAGTDLSGTPSDQGGNSCEKCQLNLAFGAMMGTDDRAQHVISGTGTDWAQRPDLYNYLPLYFLERPPRG
ncbi:MAG: hypothetical protein ABFS23_02055 [Pseudomonadota bacterium]